MTLVRTIQLVWPGTKMTTITAHALQESEGKTVVTYVIMITEIPNLLKKKQPTSISAVFEQESQQDKIIGFYWGFFRQKIYRIKFRK